VGTTSIRREFSCETALRAIYGGSSLASASCPCGGPAALTAVWRNSSFRSNSACGPRGSTVIPQSAFRSPHSKVAKPVLV